MNKIVKRTISITMIGVLFFLGLVFFRYIVTDDTNSYTRIMMHQLYDQNSNVDVLFVGSSHVYRSLIPDLADSIFDQYTFNAGTSSQHMDGSYAIIREALENNDVSTVYLELYYDIAVNEPYKKRTKMTGTYIIADYIKNPLNRSAYLLHASSKDYYVNSFIIARRNWETLLDWNEIRRIIQKKHQSSYQNYEYVKAVDAEEYYVDRGFVANDSSLSDDKIWYSAAYDWIDLNEISEDYLHSLSDIVSLCEEKGVKLVFFIAPMPVATIAGKENYDEYSNYMKNLAKEWGLEFYDFNLCREKYFDTADLTFFKDEDHLNTKGAEAFTKVFSSFFAGQIPQDDLFYDSMADKLSSEDPSILGLAVSEDTTQSYIISTKKEGVEYRVIISPAEGDETVLQDFSEEIHFELPQNSQGTIEIQSRKKGSSEILETVETAFLTTDKILTQTDIPEE